ncbi:hypothetical protein [Calorimonas adulescens]|uniref:Holin n=1 Tax=Calorimonas adulescens TaxID=2606906 RepID=A0A5D8QER8_9THEO|nr:hypothetical protein [Calorimonas adulescens]TZE82013.1 hypothetical protein FWJ32_07210 [Calorimonas adulescens]
MPGAEIAQYGIGFFTIAGLIFLVNQWVKQRENNNIAAVIENNTKALEQVSQVIQSMQITLARQEAKLDELLERARR